MLYGLVPVLKFLLAFALVTLFAFAFSLFPVFVALTVVPLAEATQFHLRFDDGFDFAERDADQAALSVDQRDAVFIGFYVDSAYADAFGDHFDRLASIVLKQLAKTRHLSFSFNHLV